jgi:hypothetical protein
MGGPVFNRSVYKARIGYFVGLMLRALLGWVVGTVVASGAVAQQAPADDSKSGPALNWTRQPGAESCIGSVELAARIEERVKKKIFVAAPEAIVAVEGYAAPRANGGFRAAIAMSDGQGHLYGSRELETQGACSELNDGLVFVIAVTLRPEAGSVTGIELPENVASALDALFGREPTEPDPAAFPAAPPVASAPEPAPPPPLAAAEEPPSRASERGPSVRAFLEALGTVQLGLQPDHGLGGGGGLRLAIARAGSLSLHGALFAQSRRDAVDLSDDGLRGSADFRARMLSLGYCTPALLESSVLGFEACAAGRIGDVIAHGQDFDNGDSNRERASLFLSLGLAARLTLALSTNVVLALAAGPEAHLARPVFEYETRSEPSQETRSVALYKASALAGAAELSVAFALF